MIPKLNDFVLIYDYFGNQIEVGRVKGLFDTDNMEIVGICQNNPSWKYTEFHLSMKGFEFSLIEDKGAYCVYKAVFFINLKAKIRKENILSVKITNCDNPKSWYFKFSKTDKVFKVVKGKLSNGKDVYYRIFESLVSFVDDYRWNYEDCIKAEYILIKDAEIVDY